MKPLSIGRHRIGYGQRTFIIAEAGVNHNGKLSLALKLVDAAAAAGADAVKFQTFKAAQVVTRASKMAAYQQKNVGATNSQMSMLKKLELQSSWYQRIRQQCRKRNIMFLATPHGGFSSVDELQRQNMPAFKFGSGELTNAPVLAYTARLGKPMIISTGMATMKEVEQAVQIVSRAGNKKIILLHATTNYPCPPEEVNLAAMQTMMKRLPYPVGYSDHTVGVAVPYAAVMLGACIIEKHLTLDQRMPGPDHRASTEPEEFALMVKMIRQAQTIMGSPIKKPNPSEKRMIPTVRKSLVTTRAIRRGELFTAKNIGIKRPGTGLSPLLYFSVLGRKATTDLAADMLLSRKHYG